MSVEWKPPSKVEGLFAKANGSIHASFNAATAGARSEQELPVGSAQLQLYSLATPNGQKLGILLEELDVEYDAHVINLLKGDQFTSGFVQVNPNSKIPALLDKDGPDGKPINLFESASIALYLGEKYGRFIPRDPRLKAEMMNWLFWQMGGLGPFVGQFGHFFSYAPAEKVETKDYGVARYGMEVQRLCSLLDQHLEGRRYMVGDEYTLADIMIFPWYQALRTGYKHSSGITAKEFLY